MAAALVLLAGALPVLAVGVGWTSYLDWGATLVGLVGGLAAGAWLSPRWAVLGTAVAAAGLTLANQLHDTEYHWLDDLVFFAIVVGGPAIAAALLAARSGQIVRLEKVQAELDEQQRVEIAAARLDEQSRLHGQVHTELAEQIAAIALRAQGAQRASDAAALRELEDEARTVLDRLREVLGTLGGPTPDPPPIASLAPARPSPSRLDVGIAVALGAGLAVESVVADESRGPWWLNVVAALAVAAPLVWRRGHPILSATLALGPAAAFSLVLTPYGELVVPLALLVLTFFSIGAWCRGAWAWWGWLVAAGGSTVVYLGSGQGADLDDGAWVLSIWWLGSWVLGRVSAGHQARLTRLRAALVQLETGRDCAIRLALAEERQSVASELHDSVAHAMTVVCVQAGAHGRGGADAQGALSAIASTAHQCLVELRDGLELLDDASLPFGAEHVRAIGRRVGVEVEVEMPRAVGGPAGAVAFRVVRESLVNAARHAVGAPVRVTMAHRDGDVRLDLVNGRGRAAPSAQGSGHGLTGLADVVAAAGGRLEWGPSEDGFRVSALIPADPR